MSSFKLDAGALEQAVQQAVDAHRKDVQPVMDRFCRTWQGRPTSQVKPALRAEFARHGLDTNAATIADLAVRVSNGERIERH